MTETTTEQQVTTIEAQHKRAAAHADAVTFHLHEGQGYIRLHRRAHNSPSGFDEYVQIYTETRIEDYHREDGYRSGELGDYEAFHMEHSGPKYDIQMLTLFGRVSVGDTIRLHWIASNNNENQKRIGWHRDELRMEVLKHKTNKREVYLVEARVGPNDTARMVRRVR